MTTADEDREERRRVFSKIAPLILIYARDHAGMSFHAEELRRYVLHLAPEIAPDSPGRILRELRLRRQLDYVVLNRRQSLYQFRRLIDVDKQHADGMESLGGFKNFDRAEELTEDWKEDQ